MSFPLVTWLLGWLDWIVALFIYSRVFLYVSGGFPSQGFGPTKPMRVHSLHTDRRIITWYSWWMNYYARWFKRWHFWACPQKFHSFVLKMFVSHVMIGCIFASGTTLLDGANDDRNGSICQHRLGNYEAKTRMMLIPSFVYIMINITYICIFVYFWCKCVCV